MIDLRRVLLCRMPLGPDNMDIQPEELTHKVKQVLQEVAVDIPIIKALRSCTVETKVEARSSRMFLNVYLQESAQLSLFRSSAARAHNRSDEDLFLQELDQAILERQSAGRQIETATGIAAGVYFGNEPASHGPTLRTVRGSINRRLEPSGMMHVAGLPEPVSIGIEKPPKILSEATLLTISATVNSLTRTRAQLSQITLEAVGAIPQGSVFHMPDEIYVIRAGAHKSLQSGTRLQIAMDSRQPLKMKVLLTYDWVDGRPSLLELVDFVKSMNLDQSQAG